MPNKAKKFLIIAVAAGCLAGFSLVSWMALDTVFHVTGNDQFCSSCHSHQPIGSSYRASLHGGNNPQGWQANCSDCHIPQDNAAHYVWVKSVHGVVDPIMEIIKDPYDIDWHSNRERREEYTYDSGCLRCHVKLAQATESSSKAFLPHRHYFAHPKQLQCVSCHQHVGHDALGLHLQQQGWPLKKEDTP